MADLLEMQDEIVARLAGQLDAPLISAEARRAERAPHPNSMDLLFQGAAWLNKGMTPNNLLQAKTFYERALALAPDNVDALACAALVHVQFAAGFSGYDQVSLAVTKAAATKALSLAPEHALSHLAMSMVLGFSNRNREGDCRSPTESGA